jgi:hypothetical protein
MKQSWIVQKKGSFDMQIPSVLLTAHDASFKLLVIKYCEETNNCTTLRKNSIFGAMFGGEGKTKNNY